MSADDPVRLGPGHWIRERLVFFVRPTEGGMQILSMVLADAGGDE
jgi:hypothetical protein